MLSKEEVVRGMQLKLDVEVIFEFVGYRKNATLRFHMIRENEKSWLKSDLETYKDEVLMIREC